MSDDVWERWWAVTRVRCANATETIYINNITNMQQRPATVVFVYKDLLLLLFLLRLLLLLTLLFGAHGHCHRRLTQVGATMWEKERAGNKRSSGGACQPSCARAHICYSIYTYYNIDVCDYNITYRYAGKKKYNNNRAQSAKAEWYRFLIWNENINNMVFKEYGQLFRLPDLTSTACVPYTHIL